MKPMGRKYFRNKTGSKHHVKIRGKFAAWWTDVCTPSKKRERQQVKSDIAKEIDDTDSL
jgi:hypothetical protein